MTQFCSIANKNRTRFGCFSGKQLQKIARGYNQHMAGPRRERIRLSQPVENLWRDLRHKLSDICSDESCWLDLQFVKEIGDEELLKWTYPPKGPTNQVAGAAKWKWLSTRNIDAAMEHFEKVYPHFIFFGPVPIDFAEIFTELNNLNLVRLYRQGTRQIGIVFNFDPHTELGSHWVSLMIDLNSRRRSQSQYPNASKIAYFDSFGSCPPPKPIQDFIANIQMKAKQGLGLTLQVLCNKTRHQFSSSECGVYSIYFLEKSLQGQPFTETFADIVSDYEMNQNRARFFRR